MAWAFFVNLQVGRGSELTRRFSEVVRGVGGPLKSSGGIFGLEDLTALLPHMGVSRNRGPKKKHQNTMILVTGTPKKGLLIFETAMFFIRGLT